MMSSSGEQSRTAAASAASAAGGGAAAGGGGEGRKRSSSRKQQRGAAAAAYDGRCDVSLVAPATKLAAPKRQRRASSAHQEPRQQQQQQQQATTILHLPHEVVQLIGAKLEPNDLQACRLVCTLWAKLITADVSSLTMGVHPDAEVGRKTITTLRSLMPVALELQLHVSSRLPQATADAMFDELKALRSLRGLTISGQAAQETKWPVTTAPSGPTLKTFSAVCALTQVASLSFHNVPTLGAPDLGALTALTALTRLRMTSDLHHAAALDHYRAHAARPAQPLAPPHGVVGAPAWAALCQLTSLRHLEVPVAGLLDARALSALWALTCLVLQGQAVVLDGEQTYYSSSAAPAAGAGAGRQPARAGQGAEPPLVETPGTHCSLQRLLPNLEVLSLALPCSQHPRYAGRCVGLDPWPPSSSLTARSSGSSPATNSGGTHSSGGTQRSRGGASHASPPVLRSASRATAGSGGGSAWSGGSHGTREPDSSGGGAQAGGGKLRHVEVTLCVPPKAQPEAEAGPWWVRDLASGLQYLRETQAHCLRKLVVRCVDVTSGEVEAGLQGLPALEHLELYCAAPHQPAGDLLSATLSAASRHLPALTALLWARPLACHAARDEAAAAALDELASTHGERLLHLELEGVLDGDLAGSMPGALLRFARLRTLALKCADTTRCRLPVWPCSLPRQLTALRLRFAQLQCAGSAAAAAMPPGLQELSLTNCTADSSGHFKALLGGLVGLSSLQLEGVGGLTDEHVVALSALTSLTSLGVMAVSNQHVTNAAMAALTTLTALRKLTWHVGDMLDCPPDAGALKSFKKLLLLSLTTSMFFRLSRWGALNVIDFLPYCQVETWGP